MKKLMLLLMSLMLCFGMTACANGDDLVDDNGTVVEDTGDNDMLDNDTLPENVDDVDLTNPNTPNNDTTTVTP